MYLSEMRSSGLRITVTRDSSRGGTVESVPRRAFHTRFAYAVEATKRPDLHIRRVYWIFPLAFPIAGKTFSSKRSRSDSDENR